MKKISFLLVLSLSIIKIFSQNSQVSFETKGPQSLNGIIYITSYLPNGNRELDSIRINKGYFAWQKKVDNHLPITFVFESKYAEALELYVQNGDKIKIKFPSSKLSEGIVTGSNFTSLFEKAKIEIKSKGSNGIIEYFQENPSSVFATYFIGNQLIYSLDYDELKSILDSIQGEAKQTYHYFSMVEKLQKLEKVRIGMSAPNFSLPDTSGTEKTFYQYIKDKEYTLLDFWASWCGPCRKENPNVVEAYHTYSNKGFGIFAVSFDNDASRWKAAIVKDQLIWEHVSGLGSANETVANLYVISSIPSNVLVDRDGKIVARNLRGEELQLKLKELLEQ